MPRTGRRQLKPGEKGIYLSQWWPEDDLKQLDELVDLEGSNRSETVKAAVAQAREQRTGRRQRP